MNLAGFALAVLLIELTPGPNMAWLAGLAATEGRRHGLAAVVGVALGLLVNAVLAAFGLATLLSSVPGLWDGLRYAGAAMMLWLAFETWRGTRAPMRKTEPGTGLRRAFATGAMINLLNPKAYLFFVVVAPQFLGGRPLSIANALVLATVSTVIATAIHFAIVMTGGSAHAWLNTPERTQTVRRAFALVMAGVAASFLLARPG